MIPIKEAAYEIINGVQLHRASDKSVFEMVKKIQDRFVSKGIEWNELTHIGYGVYGVVFKINNNMVMKFTTDKSELHTMTVVMNNPSEFIVKVHDVFKVKVGTHVRYIIVEELLEKASVSWRDFTNNVTYGMFLTSKGLTKSEKWNKKYRSRKPDPKPHHDKMLWIQNVCSFLEQHNIKYGDLHGKNIMKRGKLHVVIDLGMSRCPKQNFASL